MLFVFYHEEHEAHEEKKTKVLYCVFFMSLVVVAKTKTDIFKLNRYQILH